MNLTFEELVERFHIRFGWDNQNAIRHISDFLPSVPKPPIKPVLSQNHTSEDVSVYATALKEYEEKYTVYSQLNNEYKAQENLVIAALKQYICEEAGINNVPEEYRYRLKDYVFSRHSINHIYDALSSIIEEVFTKND